MFKLNEYQAFLINLLENTDYKVCDYVPSNADMPLIIVENMSISKGKSKVGNIFNLNQTINIFSDYEGKKEINEITNKVIDNINSSIGCIIDSYSVCDINFQVVEISKQLEESNIFYKADIIVNFTLCE